MEIQKYKSHPWHGINSGKDTPDIVTAFIEIVSSDTIKYEIDKESGYLMVGQPQKFSDMIPALNGFISKRYCDEKVAPLNMQAVGKNGIKSDGDSLDILVLPEKEITRDDILVHARPIGGFRLNGNNEADDKILAVIENNVVYDQWIRHYRHSSSYS